MSARKKVTLFVVLVIALLSIVYPSKLLLEKAYADNEALGSTIGGIAVDNISSEELRKVLTDEINRWTSEPLVITGGGTTLKINTSAIHFDIDATVTTYESMTKKNWYAFWKSKKAVQIPLEIVPSDSLMKEISNIAIWQTDSTYNKVIQQAAYLGSHEIEADVSNLSRLENDRIALAIEEIPKEAKGVSEIVNALNDQIINPHETFSFLEKMGGQVDLVNREALNFGASILYSIALNTNSEILERTSQNVIPTYLEAGIEAAVERDGSKDLRFINTTSNAIKLKFSIEGDNLKAEAYSTNKEQDIKVRVVRDHIVEPRIITRYSKELNIGEELVVEEGTPGLRVSVFRYSSSTGEEVVISKDYYAPKNRIILKSSRQSVQENNSNSSNSTSLNNENDLENQSSQNKFETNSGEVIELPLEEEQLPPSSYYDKGGNLITP